nr:CYP6CM1v4 [Bemisia tabaci]
MELLEIVKSAMDTHSVLLIFLSVMVYLLYVYRDKFHYWSKRGVPCQSPAQSIVRTFRLVLRMDSFTDNFYGVYKAFDGHPYVGSLELTKPILVVRDPELARIVLVKSFSSFSGRLKSPDTTLDPLSNHLFTLNGEKWRQVRHKTATAFSTAKLKNMFHSLKDCAREMDAYMERAIGDKGDVEFDALKVMSNYTLEVIGACAMGIKCDSIHDEETEFKRFSRDFFRFDARRMIFTLLDLLHPKLPVLLKWKAVRPEVENFFREAIKEAASLKESEAAARTDFLQILIDFQKSEKASKTDAGNDTELVFTDNIIGGVIGSFFSAGYEPTAAALTFCLYELARNPQVQAKLHEEILAVKEKLGDDIEYETLKEFKYANQVIDETLRLYPGSGILVRTCTEPFKLPDSDVVIEKGTKVFVSSYGLQTDPRYFPEPEKFDPERFSEENKEKILPGTYLPFGDGPRLCIAMRLALMDVKMMMVRLVSKYEIHTTPKTPKKITFDTNSFTVQPAEKVWLRFRRRASTP